MSRRPLVRTAAIGVALSLSAFAAARDALSNPGASLAAGPIAVRAAPGGANVRAGPGMSEAVLGVLREGSVYAADERRGDWLRIWFDRRQGYVHASVLDDDARRVVRITADALNVREGPGTDRRIVAVAAGGEHFVAAGASGKWRQIAFGGRDLWVHGAYLYATSNDAPEPGRAVSHAGYLQLAAEGPGYYGYGVPERRWGTPRLVHGLERVAQRWVLEAPAGASARFGVGDLSYENGGAISGHVSHRKGVDVDVSLVRDDWKELPRVDRFSPHYSRAGVQKLVGLFREELPVTYVFFNDPLVHGVSPWPNHDNHLHVRIAGP